MTGKHPNRLIARSVLVVLGLALASLVTASGALAATPFKDISSGGPLDHVNIGDELSCQVHHTGDAALSFYPSGTIPGDCGTHLFAASTLFTPDYSSHGSTATGSLGARTPFTPVSQTGVTGSGTAASPFTVVTVADAGATGLRITETDTYVVGQESYRTDITVSNSGQAEQAVKLYRAADCYLQDSDNGFGFVNTGANSVGCSVNANNTPADRIEEWFPITGGNNYTENGYSTVWGQIGSHNDFPDTCICGTFTDNGAGISWSFSVPAGGSATRSHFTTFSPTGQTGPPQPAASINNVSQNEGDSGTTNFTFTVTLDRTSTDEVKIDYATADGTANQPGDYGLASGTLTFAPGTTSQTITVAVVGDTTVEPNETFFVNLPNAQNATISDAQGDGTIVNDDSCPPGNEDPSFGCEQNGTTALRGAYVPVLVSCPRYRWRRCTGVVSLEARRAGRRVTLGKRSFHKLLRGTKRVVKVKLSRRGRRIARASGHLRVRVIAADRVRVGKRQKLRTKRRAVSKITLRARRAR